MAQDLGSIPYTDVNQGTRVVDRSLESRAIGQGLTATKQGIDAGLMRKVTNDMVEAMESVPNEVIEPEPLEYEAGSREEYLSNRLDRLLAVMEQGKVSQRTLAEIQVKQVLTEAQKNYRWLYDKLAQRAGAIIAGSAHMEQLGIGDTLRKEAAAMAKDEYKAWVDHAQLDWEKGGLGIDPSIDPRSGYFMKEYTRLQGLRNTQQEGTRLVAMALANARITMYGDGGEALYSTMDDALTGYYSQTAAAFEDLKKVHQWDYYLEQVNKGMNGDLQFIEQFRAANVDIWVSQLLSLKSGMKQMQAEQLATLPPEVANTDRGKFMVAKFNDVLAGIDEQINWVRAIKEGGPNAEQIVNRGMTMMSMDVFKRMPKVAQEQTAFFNGGPGSKMLEMMGLLKNPAGLALANQVSLSQQTAFAKVWPEVFDPSNPNNDAYNAAIVFSSTGALQIPPGASAGEIQAKINEIQKNPNATWVVPTKNGQEETVMALKGAELHLQLLGQAQSTLTTADAEFANAGLLGLTYSLSYLNDVPNPPNVQQEMLDALANGSLGTAVNVSLSGMSNGERNAFGAEAQEFYMSTDPFKKRAEAGERYRNTRIGGVAISEMVSIDTSALEKDEFKWVYNDEALDKAAAAMPYRSMRAGGRKDLAEARRRVEAQVDQAMSEIYNQMNQQISIEMLLNKAKAPNAQNIRQEDSWTAFFLGAGDPAGQQNAWANYFKYTD